MVLRGENATEYTPRFSFEISEDLKNRVNNLLSTDGIRRAIMTPILEDLLDMIEEHGQIVVGVILDSGTKPREVIKSMAKAEKRSK